MNLGLLAPTLEDVDLVMSWLPRVGAEDFRSRLLEIRSKLLTAAPDVFDSGITEWLEWAMDYKDPAEHPGKEK